MVLSVASVRVVRVRSGVALSRSLVRRLVRSAPRLRQVLEHRVRVVRQRLAEVLRHRSGPEEVVIQRIVRIDSLGWIDDQQFVQQIQRAIVVHVGLQALLHLAFRSILWLHFAVQFQLQFAVQLQLLDARPLVRRQRTAQLTDQR